MDKARTPIDLDGNEQVTELTREIGQALAISERVVHSADAERLQSMARLVNSFNFAIQVQGKRVEWVASDIRSFFIALSALDTIGQVKPSNYD